MGNEITPPGTARTFRVPPSKSVVDKKKTQDPHKKKHRTHHNQPDKPDNDEQAHIDEYI